MISALPDARFAEMRNFKNHCFETIVSVTVRSRQSLALDNLRRLSMLSVDGATVFEAVSLLVSVRSILTSHVVLASQW